MYEATKPSEENRRKGRPKEENKPLRRRPLRLKREENRK